MAFTDQEEAWLPETPGPLSGLPALRRPLLWDRMRPALGVGRTGKDVALRTVILAGAEERLAYNCCQFLEKWFLLSRK